jgi:hypothetical protein
LRQNRVGLSIEAFIGNPHRIKAARFGKARPLDELRYRLVTQHQELKVHVLLLHSMPIEMKTDRRPGTDSTTTKPIAISGVSSGLRDKTSAVALIAELRTRVPKATIKVDHQRGLIDLASEVSVPELCAGLHDTGS